MTRALLRTGTRSRSAGPDTSDTATSSDSIHRGRWRPGSGSSAARPRRPVNRLGLDPPRAAHAATRSGSPGTTPCKQACCLTDRACGARSCRRYDAARVRHVGPPSRGSSRSPMLRCRCVPLPRFIVNISLGCDERHGAHRKACAMRREPARDKRRRHLPGVTRGGIDGNVSGTHLFSMHHRHADDRRFRAAGAAMHAGHAQVSRRHTESGDACAWHGRRAPGRMQCDRQLSANCRQLSGNAVRYTP